jgi:hypothetical protein
MAAGAGKLALRRCSGQALRQCSASISWHRIFQTVCSQEWAAAAMVGMIPACQSGVGSFGDLLNGW